MQNINLYGLSGKIGAGKDTIGNLIMMHRAINESYNLKGTEDKLEEILSDWESNEWMFSDCSGFEIKKFAGKLKQIISLLTGIPILDLEKAEVKDSLVGEEWAYLLYFNGKDMLKVNPNRYPDFEPHRLKNYTFRQMLQLIGTDLFRNQLHENVWVNSLFSDYCLDKVYCGGDIYVTKNEFINKKEVIHNNKNFSVEELLKANDKSSKWIITDVRFPNEAEAIKKRGGILIRTNNPDYVPYENEHLSETALDSYNDFDYIIENDKSKGLKELSQKVKNILENK